ncbi:MAG: gliding motility-associated C-terminal domain-containing protein [Bacteroidia bacterium]|nr:gliding motility-associated C-terminal domain-containing protein [Bacteroidia bacterium]
MVRILSILKGKLFFLFTLLFINLGAKAQPLHAWWTLNYKAIARDTGVQFIPWKLQYPTSAILPDENNASWFDDKDSLQYFMTNGALFTKRSDSVIFDKVNSSSCWQGSMVYHDKLTDTIYFCGKYNLGGSGFSPLLFKVHPNRKKIDIFENFAPGPVEECMALMRCINGRIWMVSHITDSDTWVAVDLRTHLSVKSIIANSKHLSSKFSGMVFHPSGKFIIYHLVSLGREPFQRNINILNFNLSTGHIGFRITITVPNFTYPNLSGIAGMCFDTSGRNLYFATYGQSGLAQTVVLDFQKAMEHQDNPSFRTLNSFFINTIISKMTLVEPGYIFTNLNNSGYGIIKHTSGAIEDVEFVVRSRPNINDESSFSGGPEASIEQITLPAFDTITFFNAPIAITAETFFIPNAFTPSGDFLNDGFGVYHHPLLFFSKFSLTIYNRWGGIVFHSTDPEAFWDGNYKGKPCPEGTYCYTFRYQIGQGNENKKQGCVQLLRRNDE